MFSSTGERREDVAALRDQGEAEARDLVRLQRVQQGAVEADLPGRRRVQPHECADHRGLAHAIAAEHGGAGGVRHLHGHALQHVRLPPVSLEVLDFQHQLPDPR